MTTFLTVLATTALILLALSLLICAVVVRFLLAVTWVERHDEARRRKEQGREVDAAYMQSLREDGDVLPVGSLPIYDAISREFADRELSDDSIAAFIERNSA